MLILIILIIRCSFRKRTNAMYRMVRENLWQIQSIGLSSSAYYLLIKDQKKSPQSHSRILQ